MAFYQLTVNNAVIRLSDGAVIPPDQSNSDRAEYTQKRAKHLADGNLIIDFEIPAPVPLPPLTFDQIYDQSIIAQQVLKAVILSLNDGSLPIGTNKTGAQLKTIIKNKM